MGIKSTRIEESLGYSPFTVSAVFCDGSGNIIQHCFAADAQSARDQVLMQTGGAVIIASVFIGHLSEPDEEVRFIDESSEIEAVGSGA